MYRIFPVLLFVFFMLTISEEGLALKPEKADLTSHPPRIIRSCCFFGTKIGIMAVPFVRLSALTSMNRIGSHRYLGGASEGNGVIYTRQGGFIDMGHMRDQADWTAFLYALLQQEREMGMVERDLGYEGGQKRLKVLLPTHLCEEDVVMLAGRIAYDLSVWHEIATWYGVSSVPMVPEQFSSFSPEDPYSNLLGVTLGMKAVQSDLPYDEAMTILIGEELAELDAVTTEQETVDAMEAVREVWWTRSRRFPSSKIVMLREATPYDSIYPRLIPSDEKLISLPQVLTLPQTTFAGDSLVNLYEFSIALNQKFPVKRVFSGAKDRVITQHEFDILLGDINEDYHSGFLRPRKNDKNGSGKVAKKNRTQPGKKKKQKLEAL